MFSLKIEVQQTLLETVNRIREFIQGAQYWTGGVPIALSHCFFEKDGCGGLVEITKLEDWTHYLNLHCIGCDKDFIVYYKDFGLEEILACR